MTTHDAGAAPGTTMQAETPRTPADRLRNLVHQFSLGLHTLDEMPGLILATLDRERRQGADLPTAEVIAAAREWYTALDAAKDAAMAEPHTTNEDVDHDSFQIGVGAGIAAMYRAILAATEPPRETPPFHTEAYGPSPDTRHLVTEDAARPAEAGGEEEDTRAFAALQTAMGTLHHEATTVVAGLRAQGFEVRRATPRPR